MYILTEPKIDKYYQEFLSKFPITYVNSKRYGNHVDCACFLIDFGAFSFKDINEWSHFLMLARPNEFDTFKIDKKDWTKDSSTHFVRMWWD